MKNMILIALVNIESRILLGANNKFHKKIIFALNDVTENAQKALSLYYITIWIQVNIHGLLCTDSA